MRRQVRPKKKSRLFESLESRCVLAATDYYFVESYQIIEGSYAATADWRSRIDLLQSLRQTHPV